MTARRRDENPWLGPVGLAVFVAFMVKSHAAGSVTTTPAKLAARPPASVSPAQPQSRPLASIGGRVAAGEYVRHPDGTRRVGGSRSWRNNNPGNIRGGPFAQAHGAAGGDRLGFAVFPSESVGAAAHIALLRRSDYARLTLAGAIARWAPSSDGNDPAAYAATVSRRSGIALGRRLSTLSPAEMSRVQRAMRAVEGWHPGRIVR